MKNSQYFVSAFKKTFIPLALVGYEMLIAKSYPTPTRGITVKYTLPPCLAYKLPPMNPFTGAVAAYTNIVVLRMEPRLYINRK